MATRKTRTTRTGKTRPNPGPVRPRNSKRTNSGQARWKWLLLALLFGGLTLAVLAVYFDQTVRVRFEGQRWALPARVYGRPLELFNGAAVSAQQLDAELQRLGYQRVRHPDHPGSYSSYRGRYLVRTRPFDFWDGREPSRYLELQLADGRIGSLKTANDGAKLALLRLEAPQIASIFPAHNEDRQLVRREDLPRLLVAGLIAVEDRDFYRHRGIDVKAIARALWQNIRAGEVVQGGSTLTQQLVKNFFLTSKRSLWRKLNEAAMALILELRYDKDEILEAYANEIYLGQDRQRAIHGFNLAARFYFKQNLEDLKLAQTALLVALVKGPSLYDPRRHPERATERRNLVLDLMVQQGVITAAEGARAKTQSLQVSAQPGGAVANFPAFLDLVRRQLHRDYREQDLNSEGLRIFTTLDPWIQEQAEQAMASRLTQLEQQGRLAQPVLEGAAVVASVDGAEVLAIVGGRRTGYAGFNRALDAIRPIGSLIKPAVYLEALSRARDYNLLTRLQDQPIRLKGSDGKIWAPQNYEKQAHGEVPLHLALEDSYNLATVRLGLDLGLKQVAERLRSLGVGRPVEPYPSMLLGATSLSPLEITQVYQTLAAGGFLSPLRAISEVLDADGRPLNRYPLTLSKAADPAAVYLLNWVLQDVVRRGTGKTLGQRLERGPRVAGKTGTTDDLRDSWFAGFSADKVATVWVGRDDNQPAGLTGARGAMQVWGDIITKIPTVSLDQTPPESVETVWVDPVSGMRADANCPGASKLPYTRGSAPQVIASCAGASRVGGFFKRLFE